MKKLLLIASSLLLGFWLQAQAQGKIIYEETITIKVEGLPDNMKDMLPPTQSFQKELWFADDETLYQDVKGEEAEDLEMSSDDGSFQIRFISDDTEDIYYKNLGEKYTVHQKGLMGKSFVVNDELSKHKWKITPEKIKYLGYECQKATIEKDDKIIVAWFSSQIPAQVGPGSFHGLPGAILMISINDGDREIKALSVELKEVPEELIEKPTKGKKVSEKEYKEVEAQKIKEMEEMHGSDNVKIRN